jgi:rubredoxin
MEKQPIYKCRVCGFESNYNLPQEEIKYFNVESVVTSAWQTGHGVSAEEIYLTICPVCGIVYTDIEKLLVKG